MTLPVLFVSSHSKQGGAESYLVNLIEELDGPWIGGVVTLERGPLVSQLRMMGCSVTVLETTGRWSSVLVSVLRLRRIVKSLRPRVIHANGVKAALVAGLATIGSGAPVVWVKHDVSHDGRPARMIARRCAKVVGVSNFVMETFGTLDNDKFHVVPTGIRKVQVDEATGRRIALETAGTAEPAKLVCAVGRLDPYKGYQEIISVAPEIIGRCPSARFVFVGAEDPSHRAWASHLREQVHALSLSDRVTFTGYRNDARLLMSGCDVGVIPSIGDHTGMGREGFSLVGLEYLTVGTPIVGYAQGALPEVVDGCARLVREGDRPALRDAIVDVLERPEERARLVDCGRKHIEGRFELDDMVTAVMRIYAEAAA